ncbi:MAG: hypothetical protein AABW84_00355 [Nanoarchaeota archaeon]
MELFKRKIAESEDKFPSLPPLPALPDSDDAELSPFPKMARTKPIIIKQVKPQTKQISPAEKTTVFIKIKKYKDIVRTIDDMQTKIDELKNTLDKISQIKTKEAEIIEGWNALLQEAQEKVADVESKLTTPDES